MKFNIIPFDTFIVRHPFLPIEDFFASEKFDTLDSYLKNMFLNEDIISGIYIASEDFYFEVIAFIRNEFNEEIDFKRTKRFRLKAVKYLNRLSTRPTPFGAFAACSSGIISDETTLVPQPRDARFSKKYRIDTAYLLGIIEKLVTTGEVRKHLKYYSNNSIYKVGESFRYVECTTKNAERDYKLSAFKDNDYITEILSAAANGCQYSNLVSILVEDGYEKEESEAFADDLIREKILISEFEPNIIGIEYHDQVLEILKEILKKKSDMDSIDGKAIQGVMDILSQITADFDKMKGEEYNSQNLKKVVDTLKKTPNMFSLSNYLQVDSKSNFSGAKLSFKNVDEIKNGIKYFFSLTKQSHQNERLVNFITKFKRRYESRAVLLSEALDAEFGIGYGDYGAEFMAFTPLVDDLPVQPQGSNSSSFNWDNEVQGFIFKKILACIKTGETEINLSKKEIDAFNFNIKAIPATFAAFVTLVKKGGNNQYFFRNWGGDSATTTLGRFSSLDKSVHELLKQIAAFEQEQLNDNQILAEINHLSDSRTANITMRTAFRDYQLPYFSLPYKKEGTISLGDIYIKITDNKARLFTIDGKEIVPIHSNAHNYNQINALPVYKFLCDIQNQAQIGRHYLHLNLGAIEQFFDHIPRISVGNNVIRSATWTLHRNEFDFLHDLPEDAKVEKLLEYFHAKKIPAQVCIIESDNKLFLDFNRARHASFLLLEEQLLKNERVKIEESPYAVDTESLVSNPEGNFANEFIIPFKNLSSGNLVEAKLTEADLEHDSVPFGENYLYFKMYMGNNLREKVITYELLVFIQALKSQNLITSWFFIRYFDNDSHIRLRLFGKDIQQDKIMALYNKHFNSYINSGEIFKTELCTYDREIQRYGGKKLIEATEAIFHADSELHLVLLSLTKTSEYFANNYWLFLIRIIDIYLDSFEMSLEEKYKFAERCKQHFAVEFNSNKQQRRVIIEKFNAEKEKIERMFDYKKPFSDITEATLTGFKNIVSNVYQKHYSGFSLDEKCSYLESFIHMSVVRGIISKNRLHEFALYNFLENYYRLAISKEKYARVKI